MTTDTPEATASEIPSGARRALRLAVKVLAPLLVLAVAGGAALHLMETSPRAERQAKPRQPRLIETTTVSLQPQEVTVTAWGRVDPAQQVTLRARVEGEVVAVSPELAPGGRFARDDVVLRIDDADYRLAVSQRESDLRKARAELTLEQGNQVIAEREFRLLGQSVSEREKTLVLRGPQLSASKADVAAAEAALAAAKLAVARTVVKAPFDATVLARGVDRGSHVIPSTDIATLVGTETYWVELVVPVAQLRWIRVPRASGEEGSAVRLFHDSVWPSGTYREGRVIRLLADLEAEGRMARLLVAVDDPLNLTGEGSRTPPLLLGSYLRAEIKGVVLDQVARITRSVLRDDDTVWLMTEEGSLAIRPVAVAYRGTDHVLVADGLQAGDRLIVSNISAVADGMPVRTADSAGALQVKADADER